MLQISYSADLLRHTINRIAPTASCYSVQ